MAARKRWTRRWCATPTTTGSSMRELLLGAGSNRDKRVYFNERPKTFENVTTIDIDPNAKPDIIFDLDSLGRGAKLPFEDNCFNQNTAYEILEHIGRQG